MEFGLFNSACVLPQFDGDEHRRIMDEVAIVQAADRVGFKYTWATEHHFLTEYSHLSANEVFLGYLAAATERIHLGSGIFNITPPVNHPARVAERVALLDHLSRGAVRVRHGSRLVDDRAARASASPSPISPATCSTRSLASSAEMWRAEEYPGFEGTFFSMPARNVLPKPYTKPHPPMWVAAGNPSTFEKAARMGLGVLCFTIGGAESVKPLIELYKKEIEHAEPVGDFVNDNVMVTTQLLCLEDGAARARARRQHGDGLPPQPAVPVPRHVPATRRAPGVAGVIPEADAGRDRRCASRRATRRTARPTRSRSRSAKYDDAGVDQVVFGLLSSTMTREVAVETIETFGTHVLPQFDRDPVHRTTRLREQQLA